MTAAALLSAVSLCATSAALAPPRGDAALAVVSSLDVLAPAMQVRVMAALVDCRDAGLDAVVYESRRTAALQAHYYARGRPPSNEYPAPVTNVADARHGWHFYGLAVDVIHRTKQWGAGDAWFARLGGIAESHGLDWGGRWRSRDLPHLTFSACGENPVHAPAIYQAAHDAAIAAGEIEALADAAGLRAVWAAVGALST